MKRIIYFEEIIYLDEGVLTELLSKVSEKILTWALNGMPAEFREDVLKHLDYRKLKSFLDEEETLPETVSDVFVSGARKQLLKIARDLEAQGKFTLELTGCPRFEKRKKA